MQLNLLEAVYVSPTRLGHVRGSDEAGCKSGYGYCLPHYGTAYGRALRNTRTLLRTRDEGG